MIRELIIDNIWRWHLLLPGMVGLAIVLAGLTPRSELRALERLRAAPLWCFVRGIPILTLPVLALWSLHTGVVAGRGIYFLTTFTFAASGFGLVARHVGERLHPDGLPWQQLVLGAVALGMMAIPPGIGICLTLLLACLGLGSHYGPRPR